MNEAQLEVLAPYEKYFGTAIRSGYAQHPGTAAVETMRGIWRELTGRDYPVNMGCTNCLMNLLRDVGTLYFAAKDIDPYAIAHAVVKTYPKRPAPVAAAKAENNPADGGKPSEGTTTPPKAKKPQNAAKKGKNAKK